MTTTDTDALIERIARELFLCERWNWYDARPDGTKTPEGDLAEREKMAAMWDADAGKPWYESQWPAFRQTYPRLAAAVLPIVAVEVRKAKAEAWDRAYWQGVQDEIDSQGFDGGMTGPNRINPYRETGDQR